MDSNEIRELLPAESLQEFDDIVTGKALGASNHIKMISNMYVSIAQVNSRGDAIKKIASVGSFFKETRGKSSYAIILALENIEKKIIETQTEDYAKAVMSAREAYFKETDENMHKILIYTDRLLRNCKAVMLFDYSSTVEKAIIAASKKLDVYIPESRVINGGYPFVKGIVETGHKVHFISDAAMLSVLDKVDMAFIGAETFYPDGTAFNTVGSDILAELCMIHHVPYYVLTPLLKGDLRAVYGIYKEEITRNLVDVLASDWPEELKEKVDFNSIELVGVDPKYITGYVTEKGILRTSDLFGLIYEEECGC